MNDERNKSLKENLMKREMIETNDDQNVEQMLWAYFYLVSLLLNININDEDDHHHSSVLQVIVTSYYCI
jgi:hypothetical protein